MPDVPFLRRELEFRLTAGKEKFCRGGKRVETDVGTTRRSPLNKHIPPVRRTLFKDLSKLSPEVGLIHGRTFITKPFLYTLVLSH